MLRRWKLAVEDKTKCLYGSRILDEKQHCKNSQVVVTSVTSSVVSSGRLTKVTAGICIALGRICIHGSNSNLRRQ